MEGRPEEQALLLVAVSAALLVVRAVAASFEAALVVVGLPRAQELARPPGAGRPARALESLLAHPESTGAAIRFAEVVSVFAAGGAAAVAGLLLGHLVDPRLGAPVALLASALAAIALSAGGRALGAARGEAVALALSLPFAWLCAAVAPIGRGLAAAVAPLAGAPGRYALPRPPLEEMERRFSEYAGSAEAPLDRTTSELIHNVFEFRDKVARDVMVPRTDVVAFEVGTPIEEVVRIAAQQGHSRIPVYEGHLDQVVGTLHMRDLVPLLGRPETVSLRQLLRPTHFVPWAKPVDRLLREMQRKRLHLAVVVDEHGGVMGICTLEDVLGEIVGDIGEDDAPSDERNVEAQPDGTFAVRGACPVADLNRATGAEVPEDQGYETVAGFLNALAGAIPAAGERFVHGGFTFTVCEATPRRVTRVRAARLKRPPAAA
jgi:CBS domain containing-hemolysin-like protein